MLSLAMLAANFAGSSAGEFPAGVPSLHGGGIDDFSRSRCTWLIADPDLLLMVLHKSFSFASNKPCITLLNYAFVSVLHQ